MAIFSFSKKTYTIEELIQRCSNHEPLGQKLLYERYSPILLGVCRRYVGDLMIAEEMLTNGFIKIFKNIDSFQGKGSFEGWTKKIMIRECLDYLRLKKNYHLSIDDLLPSQIPGEDSINENWDVDALMKILDTIPPGYRNIFNLYAIEGYKHSEIAEMLEISESTSKTQFMKARILLMTLIQKQEISLP
jgi:RNA polymerase sigma factor (sigma-70 family)